MKEYKSLIPKFSIVKEKSDFKKVQIKTSRESYDYMKEFYVGSMEIYESFFIILLNRANNTIGYAMISQGGITGTVVDPRIIAKFIADSLATGLIMGHNHPSGNKFPSEQDKSITAKIKSMASYFDTSVLDHIILTEDDYYSFADEGML
jgi:DNA repair protein RadC